jgi:hypothetical protein
MKSGRRWCLSGPSHRRNHALLRSHYFVRATCNARSHLTRERTA